MQCNQVEIRHGKTSDKPSLLFSNDSCPFLHWTCPTDWYIHIYSAVTDVIIAATLLNRADNESDFSTVSMRFAILHFICNHSKPQFPLSNSSIQFNSVDANDPRIVIDKHTITMATQWIWQSSAYKKPSIVQFEQHLLCKFFPMLYTLHRITNNLKQKRGFL